MNKLIIKKTNRVDLKNPETITEVNVLKDTVDHHNDVKRVYKALVSDAMDILEDHDHTKLDHLKLYTRYLQSGLSEENDPIRGINWFKDIHVVQERHHLNDNVPEDVNLFDVIEMIVDCMVAGLARSGSVRPFNISNDILQKAVDNTVKNILENVKAVSTKED